MPVNINRHSYIDYTCRPYIHRHGIPVNKPIVHTPQPENYSDRTIIRSNSSR